MQNPSDRLAKLLPLLGSDRPGEVAAAAGAIGRLLTGHGRDWHDLAKAAGAVFGPNSGSDGDADWKDFGRRWARADPNYHPEWTEEVRAKADRAWKEYQERGKERAWREFREHEERVKANRAAGREKARQTRARMTPEERETRKEQRQQERKERRLQEEAQQRAMGATYLSEADRMRLRECIRWCLANWEGAQDADWHYLTDAMMAARIGHWVKISPKRVEEIRRRVAGEPEPGARPKQKRRARAAA